MGSWANVLYALNSSLEHCACILNSMQMTWKEVVTHKNQDSAQVLVTTLARGYACNLCIREVDSLYSGQAEAQYITSRSKNN